MSEIVSNRRDQPNETAPFGARAVEPLLSRFVERPAARWPMFGVVLKIGAGAIIVIGLLITGTSGPHPNRAFAQEPVEQKFEEAKSAFSTEAAEVREAEVKGIEEVLQQFGDALKAQDPEAINKLLDLERLADELLSTGMLKVKPSDRDNFLRGLRSGIGTALARNHALFGFARFEIRKCVLNEGRDEAIVYARIWNSDGIALKFRYWFRYHKNQWRLFDVEDLQAGMRLTVGMALAAADVAPQDRVRVLAAARDVGEINQALLAGDVDKAEELVDKIDVTRVPALFQAAVEWRRAIVHLARGRYEPAIDACDSAERLNPNIPLVFVVRAQAYNALGRYEEARADAQKYLDTLGDDADGYLHLGQALAGMQKQDEAIRAFRRGLKDDPNSTDLLYQLALHLPEAKLNLLTEHLDKVDKKSEQFKALAALLEDDYVFKALDALVHWYAAIAPNEPEVKYYRARVEVFRAQYQEAVATLKELLARDADQTARKKYREMYELAMTELGRATEAYNDARDAEVEEAFIRLAGGLVYRPAAKEQLPPLLAAHEKRLPNSPSLAYYRGELAALHEKWAEAAALFQSGLNQAPDDAWKASYRWKVVWAMYKAGEAAAAHEKFAGDAAVFEQLAQLAVNDSNAAVLGEIIAAQAKLEPNDSRLYFYRGKLAAIGGSWDEAAKFYRAALAGADERRKSSLRWSLIHAMYTAGRTLEAYREFDRDQSAFIQLVNAAEADKNADLVETLISAHQEWHGNLKFLHFWRARAAALKQDWQRAVEILNQNAAELDALPEYKWRARDLHVRALLKTGSADIARSLAKRHWEEDRYSWTSLVVAVLERNISETERWIKQYGEDEWAVEELFWDDELAEELRSEAFKPLREKHEWLEKAAGKTE
jgi:tetratricopeptide (TPR) repeat protein